MTGEEWLTFQEAGSLLGRSPDTLRMQYRLGALKAEKRDGRLYVTSAEVDRYRRTHLGGKGWAKRHQGCAPG